MPVNDKLGKRMKRYEAIPQVSLMRRTPVAIRIDGKAHHSFTKHLNKPWDEIYHKAMEDTMMYLCQNIQNCVFGYTQSDEITLILTDYETLTTDAWFGYEVQKLCSVTASMATMKFNQVFAKHVSDWVEHYFDAWNTTEKEDKYLETLNDCLTRGAMFDARCFNIPKEEVVNLVYWRQVDAIRNSIQMCGQTYFSHNQLMHKNTAEVREMLKANGTPWEDTPIKQQRGVACKKSASAGWYLDYFMPILKGDNREYLESLI